MTKYYQWHLQGQKQELKPAYLVERTTLDEQLSNYANATSIKFDTSPVPSDKLASAILVSTEDSPNEIYAYYTDEAQTQLVFAPKEEGVTIYAPINCYQLFYNLRSVTQIDFDNFDTSNVTDMYRMFYQCRALTSLDLSNFDTSSVTNMSYMFYYCQALTSLDLSNFDTSNVTDMGYMFRNCNRLTPLDVSNFNTSSVTNMRGMFYSCRALTSLDLSNFNTSNVTDMRIMFYSCRALTSFTVGNNFTMDNVTSYDLFLDDAGRNVPNYNSSYVYNSNGTRYSRTSKLPNGANTYYTYQR